MELHFYASNDVVKDIRDGREGIVHTKEARFGDENIHVSFDIEDYDIYQDSDDRHLFKVNRKQNKPYDEEEGRDIDV